MYAASRINEDLRREAYRTYVTDCLLLLTNIYRKEPVTDRYADIGKEKVKEGGNQSGDDIVLMIARKFDHESS